MNMPSQGLKLRKLLARRGKVLAILGAPNAFHGKIMEANGVEACFVGTSITGGNYTGLPDLGILSLPECVGFAKWIARAVKIPVILDGDTGHGGIMAVRRLVRECIEAGLGGLRLDDQPLDQKRRTGSAGISIISREDAVTRYRVAVDAKNEIDRNFVIMAQCYARNAVNGGMAELLKRLRLYETAGGADWVQFESPHSVAEIKRARRVIKGPFSAMKGQLPRALTLAEHKELGLNAAWYTFLPDQVLKTAAWSFFQEFKKKDVRAWDELAQKNGATPFTGGAKLPWDATGMTEMSQLEAKYVAKRGRRS
ncbi:MAG: isocitrate lyase/PEP mutase family protein [Deltaproteobacteria bacterium]|nr:isocitrate lyase/PEP mutase family protein [Deltaproteobacteria bacterium]MBM4297122.1 isocitrate lyase/PEP mutase family protein [Deltaproteobacteria bacterium]